AFFSIDTGLTFTCFPEFSIGHRRDLTRHSYRRVVRYLIEEFWRHMHSHRLSHHFLVSSFILILIATSVSLGAGTRAVLAQEDSEHSIYLPAIQTAGKPTNTPEPPNTTEPTDASSPIKTSAPTRTSAPTQTSAPTDPSATSEPTETPEPPPSETPEPAE